MIERINIFLFLFEEVKKIFSKNHFTPGSITFSDRTLNYQGIKINKKFEVGFEVVRGNFSSGKMIKDIVLIYKEE